MGTSPAELLMGRTLRSCLYKYNLSRSVENKQEQQKLSHDKRAVERTFVDWDAETILVLVRNGCLLK